MPPPTCGTTPGGTSWATTTESAFGAARETGVGKTGVFRELGEKSEGTTSSLEGLGPSGEWCWSLFSKNCCGPDIYSCSSRATFLATAVL
jgi:hypothetical protein